MTAATKEKPQAVIVYEPRLPYHPAIEQRYGIDKSSWKALVDAIFPFATSTDSIVLALSYCKARKLDPFKRPVHIVPIWSKAEKRMVDTIWPGIGELRTTAFRTGQYAGRDETSWGPTIKASVGGKPMEYPEWAQITVYRMLGGQRCKFVGPTVRWLEAYAYAGKDDTSPNAMWSKRPFGQLEKCAEAAALREAFPEEIGEEQIDTEQRDAIDTTASRVDLPSTPAATKSDALASKLAAQREAVEEQSTTDEQSQDPDALPVEEQARRLVAAISAAGNNEKLAMIADEANAVLPKEHAEIVLKAVEERRKALEAWNAKK